LSEPRLPDLSDLIGDADRQRKRTLPPRVVVIGAAVIGALVLAGIGFFAGRASAATGPATLAEAVQQASAGKLPCGSTEGAGGQFLTALCSGNGRTRFGGQGGAGQNPAQNGTGRGAGGLLGPGSVTGTITSVSGGSMQVQTRAGTITVALPSSAQILTNAPGKASDLTAGKSVVVTASTDGSGNRTAQRVYILPSTN
jgi:hypothetical protein